MPSLTKQDIQHNTKLLIQASINGDFEEVKRLISVSDPKDSDSNALRFGALYGYTECVKLLLPLSDPKKRDSEALRFAAQKGHTECVKLLIPTSDPMANHSQALQLAAAFGYIECVKLLIPVSNPKAKDILALFRAANQGHTECVKLLIPVSNCTFVLKHMIQVGYDVSLLQQCIAGHEALQQKIRLTQTLHDASESKIIKPISAKRKM